MSVFIFFKRENGSATIFIMGAIFIIAVIFLGTFSIMEFASSELRRNSEKNNMEEELTKKALETIQYMIDDSTPFADSPLDSVWEHTGTIDNFEITLEDISSKPGINWIRKELFDTLTNNNDILENGADYEKLHTLREDTGIHLNIKSAYKEIILEDEIDNFFTAYSYFNINITNEFVLADLYELRTDKNGDSFRLKIQSARIKEGDNDPVHITKEELPNFLGDDFENLYPVINAEPVINVHFAEDVIVNILLLHYDIENDESKTGEIINKREKEEITPDMLKNIISADEDEYFQLFIYQYLGVRTWFWKLTVREADTENSPKLEWIIARIPDNNDEEDIIRYRIIEKKFTR